jgi:hypothetical protein
LRSLDLAIKYYYNDDASIQSVYQHSQYVSNLVPCSVNVVHFLMLICLCPTPVIDASEAIHEAVEPEVEKIGLPLKGLAVTAVKQIATPKRIATYVCSKIMKSIRLKMKEEGVTVHVEKVFRKGKDGIAGWCCCLFGWDILLSASLAIWSF